jgi:hypothetical protein
METSAKTFRDLKVWRKAHELVLAVYRQTEALPKTELYGKSDAQPFRCRRISLKDLRNVAKRIKPAF